MKKIISLFQRNYDGDHLVRDEVVPGAEWVLEGEGKATRKWDGTCCLVRGLHLFKRYDAKAFTIDKKDGRKIPWDRTPPEGFEPAQEADPVTGHWPGWVECPFRITEPFCKPEDQWHLEGFLDLTDYYNETPEDGTYELCGPKIGTNAEKLDSHILIRHGSGAAPCLERTFDGLRYFFRTADMEGIVWHHPDGRMVKTKGRDFGFKRP